MHASKNYAIVVALTACALVASLLLKSIVEPNFFLPFIITVVVSTWFYGKRGGLLSTVLGTVVVDFFFMNPSWGDAARLVTFVVTALLFTYLVDQLSSSKLRLAQTLSSIGDAVLVINRNAQITFLNPIAEDMLGLSTAAARRKRLSEVIESKDEAGIRQVLSGQPVLSSTHTLLKSQHGHTIAIEESAAPIRDERGRITGAIFVFRDITKRRQAQDQVSQSQKMEAVSRLAGGVAGDFNQLLTVITGYSDLLRNEMSAGNPLRRFAEEILFAAEKGAGLTRQLLAFGRAQVGQPKIIDLNTVFANMETMLRRLVGDRIEVVIMPGPKIGKVKADAALIEQAIVNLAMNSRDAMPAGGKFLIETAVVELADDLTAVRPGIPAGNYVMIAISDTGSGMDEATRAHLFEPFFTTKERGKGTGLGLSIVYGIVQQSHGFINVFSEPGAGTIFEIYLPVEREAAPSIVPSLRPKGRRGTETILIAEDESGVRKLVHAILATNGYTVLETGDGREALAVFEANQARVDMVISDVVMPHMNGLELGDRLFALNPKLKVLYISGYRDSPVGTGVTERQRLFLHKPFTPDALLTKVRELLDGAGAAA